MWIVKRDKAGRLSWKHGKTRGGTNNIAQLRRTIKSASVAYYNGSNPTMTDAQFDKLHGELEALSPNDRALISVGSSVRGASHALPHPMQSLDKAKSGTGKLDRWKLNHPGPYCVSDKLDGASAMLVLSRRGGQVRMYTRGDGKRGSDITHLISHVLPPRASISKIAPAGAHGDVAVRGELLVETGKSATGSKRYANARSHANGLVLRSAPSTASEVRDLRPLTFVAYEVVSPRMDKASQFRTLCAAGFRVVPHRFTRSATEPEMALEFKKRRQSSVFDIDGIVIEAAGVHTLSASNPKYAIAFKDPSASETRESVVVRADWKLTQTRKLVPTVVFQPVVIQGVTIQARDWPQCAQVDVSRHRCGCSGGGRACERCHTQHSQSYSAREEGFCTGRAIQVGRKLCALCTTVKRARAAMSRSNLASSDPAFQALRLSSAPLVRP